VLGSTQRLLRCSAFRGKRITCSFTRFACLKALRADSSDSADRRSGYNELLIDIEDYVQR
jgi:hypothetical protein